MIEERRLLAKERAELDDHLRSLVEREGVAREEVSRIESAAALRRVEIEKDMAVAEERVCFSFDFHLLFCFHRL